MSISASNQKRTPPVSSKKNIQFDLFSQFLANDSAGVSNAVEFWESIPKYFFTPELSKSLRTTEGLANPFSWDFAHNGIQCSVKIQPALIEQEDGAYKAYFPSTSEELVEEALKKIFSDQNYGIHDPDNKESWVRFSLSMIHRELEKRGRTRNRAEIKHAIDVMSGSVLTLYKDGKEVWKGSILQDLVTVDRDEYLADTNSHHIARLPLFISLAINKLEYRQFNYDRLMQCDRQLTRHIYKQLVHRYKQAQITNTYHFMFSTVKQNSGFLQQGNDARNRQKMIDSLEELKKYGVIMHYKMDHKKKGRKIIDVKYTITPSPSFSSEQKAANKRASNSNLVLNSDAKFVDK